MPNGGKMAKVVRQDHQMQPPVQQAGDDDIARQARTVQEEEGAMASVVAVPKPAREGAAGPEGSRPG